MQLRSIVKIAAAPLVLAFSLTASAFAADPPIELKLSHFLPERHGLHAEILEPWARELEQKSGGAVKVTVYPGPSTFGNVAKQLDQVRAGVIDIAHGLAGIPRGRLPRTSIMDMPFLAKSAYSASMALWDLYKDGSVAEDYKGVRVLALHCHNPGVFYTSGKAIRLPDDVKGLRLRTPSPALAAMVESFGGTPVTLPVGDVYENLQKGVIDGTILTWEAGLSFRLNEVAPLHTEAKAYVTCFYFVMNQAKFDALPENVRQAVDSVSGDNFVPRVGKWWDGPDALGRADAVRRNHSIITVSDAERSVWHAKAAEAVEKWLSALEKEGLADAHAIYGKAQAYVAKHEK